MNYINDDCNSEIWKFIMNQYKLTIKAGNQYWYLDTEDRRADVKSKKVSIYDLCWHRTDGPAVSRADGSQEWWLNNSHHRIDGPAYIGEGGVQQWYVNSMSYRNNKSFQEAAGITDEEMVIMILKYGDVK